MKEGQIVIIMDTSNYNNGEKRPFKAELYEITDYPCYWVRSLSTGREYELYDHQILEFLEIEEIEKILDLNQYGT